MKPLKLWSAVAIAALLAVGCEQTTTSTAPLTTTNNTGTPAVKKLSLTAAEKQTIVRGGTDDLTIKIDRQNFNAPVAIRLSQLPQGVEARSGEIVIPPGEVSATVKLKAADDAQVGEFKVDIDAQTAGLPDNVQTFTLAVKEKGTAVPDLGPM
jgi:hypothetical protein